MRPPYVAVVHDVETNSLLRIYINEDHEDGAHMFSIKPGLNERITLIPKSEVRGLSLDAIGNKAKLQWLSFSS